jgi:hypothetical protein
MSLFAGFLMLRSAAVLGIATWHKRYFVLTESGFLRHFETRDSSHALGQLEIDRATVCRLSERNTFGSGSSGFAFDIVTSRKTLTLIADSVEDLNLWIQAFHNVRKMLYDEHDDDDDVRVDVNRDPERSDSPRVDEQLRCERQVQRSDDEPVWTSDWANDGFDSDGEVQVAASAPALVAVPADVAVAEQSVPPSPVPAPSVRRHQIVLFHKRRPEWDGFGQRNEHLRAFVAWTNGALQRAQSVRSVGVDLDVCLSDGQVLCELLQFFLSLEGDVTPSLHSLEQFFATLRGSRFASRAYLPPTLNAAVIAAGNLKIALDTLWALFVAFDLGDGGVDGLLQWHANAVPTVPLPRSSDEDPLPLSALLDNQRILALIDAPASSLDASEAAARLLSVPPLLDANEQSRDAAAAIIWLAMLRRAVLREKL